MKKSSTMACVLKDLSAWTKTFVCLKSQFMANFSRVTGIDLYFAYAAFREVTLQTALYITSLSKFLIANIHTDNQYQYFTIYVQPKPWSDLLSKYWCGFSYFSDAILYYLLMNLIS